MEKTPVNMDAHSRFHLICRSRCWASLVVSAVAFFNLSLALCQTPSTGAVTGITLDPTGTVLANAHILLTSVRSGAAASVTSDGYGRFDFPLVSPGVYRVTATAPTGSLVGVATISVHVTEIVHLEIRLQLPTVQQSIVVSSEPGTTQTESSALGRVVNETAVTGLPLVTRNFAQLAGLAPGVTSGVFNAGELGLGGTALSQIAQSNDGIFVHGARSYDNNFQLDGISVSDVQGSASGSGESQSPTPTASRNSRFGTISSTQTISS